MQKSSISYILKLSIPIFFANLAIPLVGIIDTTLMGYLLAPHKPKSSEILVVLSLKLFCINAKSILISQ